jgi:hypothetical protein
VTSITGTPPDPRRLLGGVQTGGLVFFVGGEYAYGVYNEIWGPSRGICPCRCCI